MEKSLNVLAAMEHERNQHDTVTLEPMNNNVIARREASSQKRSVMLSNDTVGDIDAAALAGDVQPNAVQLCFRFE